MADVFSRLFRLPYLLMMGTIKGRAFRRYREQLDELVRRLAAWVHMDEEGLSVEPVPARDG